MLWINEKFGVQKFERVLNINVSIYGNKRFV